MKIIKVMISGVDHTVSIKDLETLKKDFPFLEYGVLFGGRVGVPRYPNADYIKELCSAEVGMMSAHLCGKHSANVLQKGAFSFAKELHDKFELIQLNYNFLRSKGWSVQNITNLYKETGAQIIIQYNKSNAEALTFRSFSGVEWLNILVDASGGRGTKIQEIVKPEWDNYTGIAGGLDKYNVEGICEQIHELEDDILTKPMWLDLESGARDSNNNFSVDNARAILEKAHKYIT